MPRLLFTFGVLVFGVVNLVIAQSACSATAPCKVGCCSQWGSCGFGPEFCSPGNCVGTCDALAECGQYAAPGKENCPLNICCSKHGFCGTTELFCGEGCQSGCSAPATPSCAGGKSADKRTIGYYESWASQRECDTFMPEDIHAYYLTHINFAFALVGPDNKIAAGSPYDIDLYSRVIGLKKINPSLRVFIVVGGWAAAADGFSRMASTAQGRSTFITSVVSFLKTYGFDGIDIDWEYPSSTDRGGNPADRENYVSLVREMRLHPQFQLGRYGITVAIPASFWYLQGFDLNGMQRYVDWFNVMAYDIRGTWDGNSQWAQPLAQPHTNISEIEDGMKLLWRSFIQPEKVVLGLGFYGRAFTLADPACNRPGCPFRGGAEKGECTRQSDILSINEIDRLIQQHQATPVFDAAAGVWWATWGDQWVSYDDAISFTVKRRWANSMCLGGTMIWAVDLDNTNNAGILKGLAMSNSNFQDAQLDTEESHNAILERKLVTDRQYQAQIITFWTRCAYASDQCPPGFRLLSVAYGKIYDSEGRRELGEECSGVNRKRLLCIEEGVIAKDCKWYGVAKECGGTCPAGTHLVAQNSRPPSFTVECQAGRYASYCCREFVTWRNQDRPDTCSDNDELAFNFGGGMVVDSSSIIRRRSLELSGKLVGYVFEPNVPPRLITGPSAGACQHTMYQWSSTTVQTVYTRTVTVDGNDIPQAAHHYLSVAERSLWHTLTRPFSARPDKKRPAPKSKTRYETTYVRLVPFHSTNCNLPDYGISLNGQCLPTTLIDEPGFALLTDDPWYTAGGVRRPHENYAAPPRAALTIGKIRPNARIGLGGIGAVFDDGNSSYIISGEELEGMEKEMEALNSHVTMTD